MKKTTWEYFSNTDSLRIDANDRANRSSTEKVSEQSTRNKSVEKNSRKDQKERIL